MRKLASIQKVKKVTEHNNADSLEIITVLGWKCVAKKGEFKEGDFCVYFEIDSLIPMKHEWARFLQDKNKPEAPARLRTIKLRGQQSQGLAMPISILPSVTDYPIAIEDGDDVTELLGVTKYEPEIPACLGGEVRGARPSYTIKTDEVRVQAYPDIINEFQGKLVYFSQKVDGTSGTFSHMNEDYQVSGRNWSYRRGENTYWKISNKYEIEDKLKYIYEKSGVNYAIQGEIAGPKIQDNLLELKRHELFVFNVMNLNQHRFLGFYEFKDFCERLDLQTVRILQICNFDFKTIDALLEYADSQTYPNGFIAEGVVIRPVHEFRSEVLGGRASFKVISNKFLKETGK